MTDRQARAHLAWLDGPDMARPSRTDWYLMRAAYASSCGWGGKPVKEFLNPIEFKEPEPEGKTWRNWKAPPEVWKRWQAAYAKMGVMARAGLVGKAARDSMVFTGDPAKPALKGRPAGKSG